jgi:hypothetical protein
MDVPQEWMTRDNLGDLAEEVMSSTRSQPPPLTRLRVRPWSFF